MLALVFEVEGERYGIPAREVLEVITRPTTRAVPGAPVWIDGLFARGADFVPIVDLVRLFSNTSCPTGAASRVAIVDWRFGGKTRALGLLAPGMTRVLELSDEVSAGLHISGKEFLGTIRKVTSNMEPSELPIRALHEDTQGVQLVELSQLLPPEVDRLLFGGQS